MKTRCVKYGPNFTREYVGMNAEATFIGPLNDLFLMIPGERYIGKVLWGGGFVVRRPNGVYKGFVQDFDDFSILVRYED